MIWAYFNNYFSFSDTIHYPSWTVPLVCISAAPVILYALLFSPILKSSLNLHILYVSVLQAQLAAVVFEEVIFRGVLWTVLRNLGLQEIVAYFISSLLFWMAHYKYMLHGEQLFLLVFHSHAGLPVWVHGLAYKITDPGHDRSFSI